MTAGGLLPGAQRNEARTSECFLPTLNGAEGRKEEAQEEVEEKRGTGKMNRVLAHVGLSMWLSGEESTYQCGRHRRPGLELQVRKIPWRRKWQPLQYSCLENPMDRGMWQATVLRVQRVRHDCSDLPHMQGKEITRFWLGASDRLYSIHSL